MASYNEEGRQWIGFKYSILEYYSDVNKVATDYDVKSLSCSSLNVLSDMSTVPVITWY